MKKVKDRLLPYLYRDKLTVNSQGYKRIVNEEINQRKELEKSGKGSRNNKETLIRLESILDEIDFSTDNFEIRQFTANDRQTLKFNKWDYKNPRNIFIYLNGLESHCGWFSDIANEFALREITTYGLDRRGSGLNTRNTGKYQDWVDDVKTLTKIAKSQNPNAKLSLISLCFGAKIASAYAIQNPTEIDYLIYLSPGINIKVAPSFSEKLKIIIGKIFKAPLNIPSPIKKDNMFTDSEEALKFLCEDKLRTFAPRAQDFLQAKLINNYVLKNLGKIITPSIVFLAGKDKIVDNKRTEKTFSEFGEKPKIIEYPYSYHTIFFGEDKKQLVSDIINFVKVN